LDINVNAALSRARELDRYWEEHKKPIGPLYVLSFTMKDQFHIEGLETPIGYVGCIRRFEGQK
jgi:amidase